MSTHVLINRVPAYHDYHTIVTDQLRSMIAIIWESIKTIVKAVEDCVEDGKQLKTIGESLYLTCVGTPTKNSCFLLVSGTWMVADPLPASTKRMFLLVPLLMLGLRI